MSSDSEDNVNENDTYARLIDAALQEDEQVATGANPSSTSTSAASSLSESGQRLLDQSLNERRDSVEADSSSHGSYDEWDGRAGAPRGAASNGRNALAGANDESTLGQLRFRIGFVMRVIAIWFRRLSENSTLSRLAIIYITPITIALILMLWVEEVTPLCAIKVRFWVEVSVWSNVAVILYLIGTLLYARWCAAHERYFEQIDTWLSRMNRAVLLAFFFWHGYGFAFVLEASAKCHEYTESDTYSLYILSVASFVIAPEVILVALLTFCFIVIICWSMCARIRIVVPAPPNVVAGATESDLEKMDAFTFRNSQTALSEDEAQCIVCLTEYEDDEQITTLPCSHHFHKTCIEQWLRQKKRCPLCNQLIDEAVAHSSQRAHQNASGAASERPAPLDGGVQLESVVRHSDERGDEEDSFDWGDAAA